MIYVHIQSLNIDLLALLQVVKVLKTELLPANPDVLDGVDDLIQLSYLNEPSVLCNLQYRYSRDLIYVCTYLSLLMSVLSF